MKNKTNIALSYLIAMALAGQTVGPAGMTLNYTLASPVQINHVVTFVVGTSQISPHTGTAGFLGIALASGTTGGVVSVLLYGQATCEFDGAFTLGNIATVNGELCHDSGVTTIPAISTALGVFGRIIRTRTDICPTCGDTVVLMPAQLGKQAQASGLNGPLATSIVSSGSSTIYTWANGTTTNGPGPGVPPCLTTVSFSSTPNFNFSLCSQQIITLAGNIVPSISNAASCQIAGGCTITIIQSSGTMYDVTWPGSVISGFSVGKLSGKRNIQAFTSLDGANIIALNPGIINQ